MGGGRGWWRRRPVLAVVAAALGSVPAACGGVDAVVPATTVPTTVAATTAPTTAASTVPTTVATTVAPATTAGAGEEPDELGPPKPPPVAAPPIFYAEGDPGPLTGLPLAPGIVNRPALAVKIDNHAAARPQTALSLADVVFEEEVEGISRFVALYHSQTPSVVGPIRSARSTDLELLAAVGVPLFAWSGGSRVVTRIVQESNVVDVGAVNRYQQGGYTRAKGRRAPHNLYADGAKLFALARANQGAPPRLFDYRDPSDPLPSTAVPVGGVKLALASTDVTLRWDPGRGGWARSQDGSAHLEAGGQQLAPENVVVLFMDYRPSPIDRTSPEAISTGAGEAWVFTSGAVVKGSWNRPNRLDRFTLLDHSGAPIALSPGRTWVELPRYGKASLL